jgi:anti-sigma regulatory factor (Ser/Thr protein kinase)
MTLTRVIFLDVINISLIMFLSLKEINVLSIEFSRGNDEITFIINDQGNGFDWEQYMEISPHRVFDSYGRGIAMANLISFDQIEYLGTGNKVCVTVKL